MAFAACVACDDEDGLAPFETTLADCGSSLDQLLHVESSSEPPFDSSYSKALASWSFAGGLGCGFGLLRGECEDGKRLLYRNGGFGSEIRYFAGEQLVGYVGSGDVGICPSVCPFSHYYGAIEDVRCGSPSFVNLCEGSSSVPDAAQVLMPFADGQAPGGCEEL
jgi:hypothetical protein